MLIFVIPKSGVNRVEKNFIICIKIEHMCQTAGKCFAFFLMGIFLKKVFGRSSVYRKKTELHFPIVYSPEW